MWPQKNVYLVNCGSNKEKAEELKNLWGGGGDGPLEGRGWGNY